MGFIKTPFPQELIDIVADNIHTLEDSRLETLRAFSLASRACHAAARKHIFRSLKVSDLAPDDIDDSTCFPLLSTTQQFSSPYHFANARYYVEEHENPDITHLHQFLLSHPRVAFGVHNFTFSSSSDTESLRMLGEQDLPNILNLLPNLRHLSLNFKQSPWTWFKPKWGLFNTELQETFKRIVTESNLQSLQLHGLRELPAEIFYQLTPSLEDLSLACVELIKHEPASDSTPASEMLQISSRHGTLKSLHISCSPSVIHLTGDLPAALNFSGLRKLDVIPASLDEVNATWRILHSATDSLEELTYDKTFFLPPEYYLLFSDISLLTRLRTFKLSFKLEFLPIFMKMLRDASAPTKITEVEIYVGWRLESEHAVKADIMNMERWQELDRELSGEQYPKLKEVDMCLMGFPWDDDEWDSIIIDTEIEMDISETNEEVSDSLGSFYSGRTTLLTRKVEGSYVKLKKKGVKVRVRYHD
ncbi:hypothetical protein BDQ12DRAFT_730219 [Crucibulum laeve]|uniref:F-box domain-containing protein n=1 Tax=Crucibulum laeve TaxID=68775 RepID=A0A5C3MFH5_9AGAR|nr:hypothetical protein BDQ12DRAFT_730219 [Crucibulum laeve]